MRQRDSQLAAGEAMALWVEPGRSMMAIGIIRAMVRHSAQRWKPARLSEPMIQTKLTPAQRGQAGEPVAVMGGVEAAAEQADAQPRRMGRQAQMLVRHPRCIGSGTNLARAMDAVLEGAELFDADRAARMHAAGGDADLGAEAELAAIGELGRGVVDDDGGIDL